MNEFDLFILVICTIILEQVREVVYLQFINIYSFVVYGPGS